METQTTASKEKRNSIILKIKALQQKTIQNGCTESEALAAAETVGKLMKQYDLNMSQVEFECLKFEKLEIDSDSKVKTPMSRVVDAIAKFTDTIVWTKKNPSDTLRFCFYGSTQDIENANYFYVLLKSAIKSETQNYQRSEAYKTSRVNGRTLVKSFQFGITSRLSQRLKEMKAENVKESKEVGTGLMTIDKMVVVNKQLANLGLRFKTVQSSVNIKSKDAYSAGKAAGDRVSISTGVGNGTKNALRLN